MTDMKVTWRSIAPIFADVVISPWNLLIGGLLIQHLSFFQTFLSLLCGYTILCLIFILYGGLGFKKRQESSQILGRVFGSKIVKYIIPLLLAAGQIGWAGVNLELGGKSLAHIFSLPWIIGIGLYTALLVTMAHLEFVKLGFVKLLISSSAILLMLYMFIMKLQTTSLVILWCHTPSQQQSVFWGVSIVVASLISFATVTPDFFKAAKHKHDIVMSTILGLLPGFCTALLGSFLFVNTNSLNLISLFSLSVFPIFPHIFNVITNTDGSTALYTPALKIKSIFPTTLTQSLLLSASISFIIAILQISLHLVAWLNFLSLIFPAFISVSFIALLFQSLTKKKYYKEEIASAFFLSLLVAFGVVWFFPPVIYVLMTPIFYFLSVRGYNNLSVI